MNTKRDGLERVLEMLGPGDTLAVWRHDQFGRTLKHLIELMGELEGQGIALASLRTHQSRSGGQTAGGAAETPYVVYKRPERVVNLQLHRA